MPDCKKCVFPRLRGCPVNGSFYNAACITLYVDRTACKKEDCETCGLLKYCKEKSINANNEE